MTRACPRAVGALRPFKFGQCILSAIMPSMRSQRAPMRSISSLGELKQRSAKLYRHRTQPPFGLSLCPIGRSNHMPIPTTAMHAMSMNMMAPSVLRAHEFNIAARQFRTSNRICRFLDRGELFACKFNFKDSLESRAVILLARADGAGEFCDATTRAAGERQAGSIPLTA